MDKIPLWTRYFKHNEFMIEKKDDNHYMCTRISDYIYKFSPLIELCEIDAINIVYDWFQYLPKWKKTDNIKYKKIFLSCI